MVLGVTIAVAGIAVVLALGWGLVAVGLRAGDQASDAAIGQAGGRLRVFRVPVVSGGSAGAGRPARAARAGDRR